jgi:hypothetical protein
MFGICDFDSWIRSRLIGSPSDHDPQFGSILISKIGIILMIITGRLESD